MLRFSLIAFALATAGCLSVSASLSPSPVGADGGPTSPATGPSTPQALSCDLRGGSPPPIAPNGYYTNGAAICTPAGVEHLFHGVDRPSLEFCADSTDVGCTHLTPEDFQLMAGWNSNVVRVALDQDRWLTGAALYDPNYTATVDQVIVWAEGVGLDVILDLHWSDRGDLTVVDSAKQAAGNSQQQPMADVNSIEFWREVATRYRGDGRVLFELYNEPNSISWNIWQSGGTYGGYQYVGMQTLYDTIRRDAQADNLVIVGGLDWSFDLSKVLSYPIQGYNIAYAAHVYRAADAIGLWTTNFGYLAQQNIAPVIVTEFGDNQPSPNCTGAWDTSLLAYANQWSISWSAWAWYVPYPTTLQSLCSFPSLISDWTGTPSVQGQAVLAALQAYPIPVSSESGVEAGSEASEEAGDDGSAEAGNGDDSTADADAGLIDATLDED
jgi:endoglucanase